MNKQLLLFMVIVGTILIYIIVSDKFYRDIQTIAIYLFRLYLLFLAFLFILKLFKSVETGFKAFLLLIPFAILYIPILVLVRADTFDYRDPSYSYWWYLSQVPLFIVAAYCLDYFLPIKKRQNIIFIIFSSHWFAFFFLYATSFIIIYVLKSRLLFESLPYLYMAIFLSGTIGGLVRYYNWRF